MVLLTGQKTCVSEFKRKPQQHRVMKYQTPMDTKLKFYTQGVNLQVTHEVRIEMHVVNRLQFHTLY